MALPSYIHIIIGPRCPWSDLWVRVSLSKPLCANLTDVTLVDEDTISILTDNANAWSNVAIQLMQSGGQL